MGARRLADWLSAPLLDRGMIAARQDAVEEWVQQPNAREATRAQLRDMFDLARLLGRIATGRAGPRDLGQVGRTLAALPKLKGLLKPRQSALLQHLDQQIHLLPELRDQLERALCDDCPLVTAEGGYIRDGYDHELDNLRELATGVTVKRGGSERSRFKRPVSQA